MNTRAKIAFAAGGIAAGLAVQRKLQKRREHLIGGRVVLITGGSRGLGLALAYRFAREGCHVAICARDEDELTRAREGLQQIGASVFSVQCDVTRRSEVEQTIEDVTQHFGRVDILVNNAGLIKVGPIESMTLSDFDEAMDALFWGVVNPTMTVLPAFLQRNRGQIVNITSIGAKVSVPHLVPYCAAKHAAAGFSEGLREELSYTGVKVTTVAPGLMRTGSFLAALFKGDREAESRWFSIGASLPGFSISADQAARQIVASVRRGDAELILTLPAKVLAKVNGIAPQTTQKVLGWAAHKILPTPSNDKHATAGWRLSNLKSMKMRPFLLLGRMAARRFNQRTA
jgi:NAD(P)-dependent dehydrogenase (short-subunit alcohol dehydrogenase family)